MDSRHNRTDDGIPTSGICDWSPALTPPPSRRRKLCSNPASGRRSASTKTPYGANAKAAAPNPTKSKPTCPGRSSALAPSFEISAAFCSALLRVQQEAAFTQGEAPDWVKEWLDAREKRAARQEQKQENKGQPADPAAAAKREASRLKRMAAGLDDLERWMCDLIRHGLGQLSGTPAWQEEAAARMVDAQLPGIAARLRNLQGVTSSGEDWPGVVLAQFGQLQLLIDAFRHLDALSPEEQADVRAALGLSPDKDEVLATGERLSDLWLVLGVGYAEENRLWRRRVWLRGQNSGRTALLLDFSHGGKHFEQSFVVGSLTDMTLAFYPGAVPLRAIATGDPVRAKTAPIPTPVYPPVPRSAGRHVSDKKWPPSPHSRGNGPCPSWSATASLAAPMIRGSCRRMPATASLSP